MQSVSKWIDGHFYRYGDMEKALDDAIRFAPKSAFKYVGLNGLDRDIYFAKKLLVLPHPINTQALNTIAAIYAIRANHEHDPARADDYRVRSIEYLKRYLAYASDDTWTKQILFEKLIERMISQAYGMSHIRWVKSGRQALPSASPVDQHLVFDVVTVLFELVEKGDLRNSAADYFACAMILNTKIETKELAQKLWKKAFRGCPIATLRFSTGDGTSPFSGL